MVSINRHWLDAVVICTVPRACATIATCVCSFRFSDGSEIIRLQIISETFTPDAVRAVYYHDIRV